LNRDKLATAISNVIAKAMSAKPVASQWSEDTGKLKLTLKRPSQVYPALELTDTIEVEALVSSDKPGTSDRLMLWISNPSVSTADEAPGAKLNLADAATGDEEGDQEDDNGAVDALAKEFKGQRWDSDKSAWK
jgi:nitrogen-specific signal transduction histidine kinase